MRMIMGEEKTHTDGPPITQDGFKNEFGVSIVLRLFIAINVRKI